MTEYYMITRPRNKARESIQLVKMMQFMIDQDVHKWVIAEETGGMGYEHWQVRIAIRNLTEEEKKDYAFLKQNFGESAHIEVCSDTWEYERKEGKYYDEGDLNLARIDRLKTRYGEPSDVQKWFINRARTSDDRKIVVWFDKDGKAGKSWLCNHLFETGKAHYIPPYCNTVERIVQTTASLYLKQWRDILVIDIPRGFKWSTQLCVAIESMKDGLIEETRYSPQPVNIRGVKILVMTNNEIDQKVSNALSDDRWDVWSTEKATMQVLRTASS